ncbi:hypothetical protein PHYBLDRAFT_151782 [Phycomyces blakesleeanus NRRL 1555(-)]|uniref:Transcription factor CBF/NF-Y/archaeal histone domain-containing protein n=1 Tax=Phycomyces blakesleeanus (strain ATCC 8743b / DSM 1359 / FGSC 10004 / NBRC 33097 / NRRL 1555) TaxID=763407 RepID=A0A162TA88_PHYB8|nr:hypothetical protein PHYBLDRAFT_151782 [Phycomyces blakesleeanus NRRL 1555(-)]OAD67172.1 hypothetical protein PHYBLDRAFT_151782 [Phycomyces blakesleeanus NRRL 1555(-)]|eukprot:XP_018285212.1 hypothetical protein PHYBLDRAFT_151782 [Phycomyces blakesleeanus NRRL 1555(-)]
MARLHSRPTLKKKIKNYFPKHTLTKHVDIMIYLDYVMFLEQLALAADEDAEAEGSKNIYGRNVDKVAKRVLQQFRG